MPTMDYVESLTDVVLLWKMMPVIPPPPVMTDALPPSSTRHDDVVSSTVMIMPWPVLDYDRRLHSMMIAWIGSSLMIYVCPTALESTSS
jgi:hypothetical protein